MQYILSVSLHFPPTFITARTQKDAKRETATTTTLLSRKSKRRIDGTHWNRTGHDYEHGFLSVYLMILWTVYTRQQYFFIHTCFLNIIKHQNKDKEFFSFSVWGYSRHCSPSHDYNCDLRMRGFKSIDKILPGRSVTNLEIPGHIHKIGICGKIFTFHRGTKEILGNLLD